MATASITVEQAQYLFANYNNISETDAQNFVAYVFGTGDRTITGTLDVSGALTAETSVLTNSLSQRTTAGLVIASATDKKLSFWGAAPVVQQVFATGAGHTVDQLITLLQTLGLCKQA